MKKFIVLAICCSLTACGTQSANMRVGTSQSYTSLSDQRAAIVAVEVTEQTPKLAEVIGVVDAQRCHRDFTEIEPSETLVTTDLRIAAYAKGADGISEVKISKQTGLIRNCWYTLTGEAVAYKVNKNIER